MRFRPALITAAVTLATLAGTTPASAYTATVVNATADDGAVIMVGTGVGVTTRNGATMDIDVTCAAVAIGRVAYTGVDCYLRNPFIPSAYYSADPQWVAGPAVTFQHTWTDLPVANYLVCIGMGYSTEPPPFPEQWMNQGSGQTCNNISV